MLHNFPEIINAAATDGSPASLRFALASRRDGENGCVSELIWGPFPSRVESRPTLPGGRPFSQMAPTSRLERTNIP